MDNLFFLLIVLVIIISNVVSIRKRLKKQQSAKADENRRDEKQKQGGWRNSVEVFLEQLKEKFEPIPDAPPGAGRRPKEAKDGFYEEAEKQPDTPVKKEDRGYRIEQGRKTLLEGLGSDADASRQKYADKRKAIQDAAKAADIKRKNALPEASPAGEFSAMAGDAYSVAQLQRAVIWSEILGSPVALRKGGQEPWVR